VVFIFTLLFIFLGIPTTALGDNSSGDHQNTYDELEEISQIYRRFVSVKTNENCSSFAVVINDAANWGRAEEIAESQLYDFAQKHANSGNKNDVIDIHYMNMNGDEVYFHRYNGSVVLPTAAETYSSSVNSSSAVSTGSSTTGSLESGNSNGNLADYSSANSSSAALTDSSGSGSLGSDVSSWHLADNSSATSSSAYSSASSSQGNYVLNTNTGKFHLPGCYEIITPAIKDFQTA